ncbi:hypothetical protein A5725_14490 [Mycobacterium kubicae]|uniref:sulfite exporter TauE/SafE family protein n=1 Tax=Mycobacterium kubicae TaxID=120959 RepID=UPI0007FBE488|nr:sulfite exporter TauE/SafE family protein [Mycobacterium kubicae]OBF20750.1 hypothetical protein A5725_14490 [Mycobacterium kubicae]
MSGVAPVVVSLISGLAVAVITAPVGVSGAVFLLPIQFSVLQVPSPSVTPTNLLFNVLSVPGALARYRRRAPLRSPLTGLLLAGTVPGVVVGALVRVLLLPGPRVFRLFAAALLLPLGLWLCRRGWKPLSGGLSHAQPLSREAIGLLAVGVGLIGGIYGIGGGSLLSPILVGRGMDVRLVAPAALTSTFVTSVAGAATYTALIAANPTLDIAPDWTIGVAAGVGGLLGGYVGASLQPRLPERALRTLLGVSAIATAALYLIQSL